MLCYKDEEVWALTPVQFYSQLEVHKFFNSNGDSKSKNENKMGYVDQIPGW